MIYFGLFHLPDCYTHSISSLLSSFPVYRPKILVPVAQARTLNFHEWKFSFPDASLKINCQSHKFLSRGEQKKVTFLLISPYFPFFFLLVLSSLLPPLSSIINKFGQKVRLKNFLIYLITASVFSILNVFSLFLFLYSVYLFLSSLFSILSQILFSFF